MAQSKTQTANPAEKLRIAINSKAKEYLSCENSQNPEPSQETAKSSPKDQLKQELQELLALYFMETTPPDRLNRLFGEVYSNVLDKTLATFTDKADNFIIEFNKVLSKNRREINRRKSNQGYSDLARKDFIDKHIVALCQKYGFELTGRPGGDKDKSDGLNSDTVEKFFREQFEAMKIPKEIADREIAQILKFVKNTHYRYDATMVSGESGEEYQVSMADKQAEDVNELERLDAQRFVACTTKFYHMLKEESQRTMSKSSRKVAVNQAARSENREEEPAAVRNARFYLTFKLFQAKPSDAFLKYIKDNTGDRAETMLIDEEWYAYLQAYDKSQPIEYHKLLPAYIVEKQLSYKLSEGTARDYAAKIDKRLSRLQEEGYFQNLIN